MGDLGKVESLSDLTSEETISFYILQAKTLIEKGLKLAKKESRPKGELAVPEDIKQMLEANPTALAHFQKLSPSHKREYLEWITWAKT